MHFVSKFSTDFVNWNVEKGQQGKYVLSIITRKEVNAIFQSEIVRNRHRKKTIFRKNSNFLVFVHFLSKY